MDAENFELAFTLAPADYRAMMRGYWRLSPTRLFWIRLLRGLALAGAALAAFSWWETQDDVDAVVAVVLLISPIGALLLNRLYYHGVFLKQHLGDGPMLVKADADGVSKTGPNGASRFPWNKIRRVVATKRQILLWITLDQAVIVPCRAFASEADQRRFLEFARTKTAGQEF